MNENASMALAFLLVTKRMYTSLCRRYKKETDPRTLTGDSADVWSLTRVFSTCVRNAAGSVFALRVPCTPLQCRGGMTGHRIMVAAMM